MATSCALEKFVRQVLTTFVQHYKIKCAKVSCVLDPPECFCRVSPRHDLFWGSVMTGVNLSLQKTFGCRFCYGENLVWCPVFNSLSDLLGFLTALTRGETQGRIVQRMTKLFLQPLQDRRFFYEVCL